MMNAFSDIGLSCFPAFLLSAREVRVARPLAGVLASAREITSKWQ
jgi:hypothetical protein